MMESWAEVKLEFWHRWGVWHGVWLSGSNPDQDEWEDCNLFLDSDLSILASDESSYDKYAQGVREEYSHVQDVDYRQGRIQVLSSLLSRPPYITANGHWTTPMKWSRRQGLLLSGRYRG